MNPSFTTQTSFEIDSHFQNLDQSLVNKSKKRVLITFVVFLLIAINAVIYFKQQSKVAATVSRGERDGGGNETKEGEPDFSRGNLDELVDNSITNYSAQETFDYMLENKNTAEDCPKGTFAFTSPYNEHYSFCMPDEGSIYTQKDELSSYGDDDKDFQMERPTLLTYCGLTRWATFKLNSTPVCHLRKGFWMGNVGFGGYNGILPPSSVGYDAGANTYRNPLSLSDPHNYTGFNPTVTFPAPSTQVGFIILTPQVTCPPEFIGDPLLMDYNVPPHPIAPSTTPNYNPLCVPSAYPTGSTYASNFYRLSNYAYFLEAFSCTLGRTTNMKDYSTGYDTQKFWDPLTGAYYTQESVLAISPVPTFGNTHTINPDAKAVDVFSSARTCHVQEGYYGLTNWGNTANSTTIGTIHVNPNYPGNPLAPHCLTNSALMGDTACADFQATACTIGSSSYGHENPDALNAWSEFGTNQTGGCTLPGRLNFTCGIGMSILNKGYTSADLAATDYSKCKPTRGYYGTVGAALNNATQCTGGTPLVSMTTNGLLNLSGNTTYTSCVTYISAARGNLTLSPYNLLLPLAGTGQEVIDNMIGWANDLAKQTFNSDSQKYLQNETIGSPNYFSFDKWITNPTFFTQIQNIDWSGYTVITLTQSRLSNEYGYARAASLIGPKSFISAWHFGPTYFTRQELIFIDINGNLKSGKPESVVAINQISSVYNTGPVYGNTISSTYSDCAVGRLTANIAVTVGVFPIIEQNSQFKVINASTMAAGELNSWVNFLTSSIDWGTMVADGLIGYTVPAAFNYNGSFDTNSPAQVPVYMWTTNKEMVIRYANTFELFKPRPKWEFFNWKRVNYGTLTNVKISTPVYKAETNCLINCPQKSTLQRAAKNGDSGSGAFIIISGKPILVGALHYSSLPYGAFLPADVLTAGNSPIYGAIHSLINAYIDVNRIMSTYTVPLIPSKVKFCGFARTPNCYFAPRDMSQVGKIIKVNL